MKDILQGVVIIGLFLIPFLPIYVANDFFFPYITGKNFAFRIIVEVIFASWALLALYDARYRPRFSWILSAFAVFLGVMALANALGAYPLQSFWSNFERMDGYVTLVHLFMLIVVMASMFTTKKIWTYFLHLSVAIALLVALHGLGQYFGVLDGPASSRVRIDSRLGNAAYMAVYMLFHIFMLLWLLVNSKVNMHKVLYVAGVVVLAVTLLFTGTRGTFLGLVGGVIVAVAYVAIFGRKYPEFRKVAIGAFIAIAILGTGFYFVRDSDFVQSQGSLARIANISITNDLITRSTIWKMAYEGVKERPLLGWGQSNFNFVFNKQYEPSLYAGESWFDRTHNIIFDWLIAGGIFGLLSYLSILAASFYYLLVEPLVKKGKGETFNVLERGVLIGLLVGYTLHNLVVFDNIISYIFFGTILALIHSRVGEKIKKIEALKINPQLIGQFVTPLVVIVLVATVYFVNAPGIGAAKDIIDAMKAPTVKERLTEFDSALARNSFAQQEIVEQLTQQAISFAKNEKVPEAERRAMIQRAELELLKLIQEKPNDARLHTFLSTFYRSMGAFKEAQAQAAIARELSPNKQAIITEQGVIELQLGNVEKATEYFKTAFELYESNTQARIFYAAIFAGSKNITEARELIGTEYLEQFAINDFALSMVNQSGDREFLVELFEIRIKAQPTEVQNRMNLAFVYYEMEQIPKAIEVLQQAAIDFPDVATSTQCYIENLQKGKKPDTGC
jgi:O-antigen ligase/Tfp pilus assembly protein PilF